MTQEIDGSQAEQLEFIPCGQILQNNRREEKPSPAQTRDHMYLILEVKEAFLTTHVQKVSLKIKRGGGVARHPIVGDVNLLINLFTRIHFG